MFIRGWWSPPASAATAAVVYREVVDGKENFTEFVIVLLTSVGDRGVRKKRAQWIPSWHSSIFNYEASVLSVLTTKSA